MPSVKIVLKYNLKYDNDILSILTLPFGNAARTCTMRFQKTEGKFWQEVQQCQPKINVMSGVIYNFRDIQLSFVSQSRFGL